jgi:hypothetical protein
MVGQKMLRRNIFLRGGARDACFSFKNVIYQYLVQIILITKISAIDTALVKMLHRKKSASILGPAAPSLKEANHRRRDA